MATSKKQVKQVKPQSTRPIVARNINEFFAQEDARLDQDNSNVSSIVESNDSDRDSVINEIFGNTQTITVKKRKTIDQNGLITDIKQLLAKHGFNPSGKAEEVLIGTLVKNLYSIRQL